MLWRLVLFGAGMETGNTEISVRLASGSEKALIEALSQFYIYDFSEMEPADSENLEFDDRGRFGGLPDVEPPAQPDRGRMAVRAVPGGLARRAGGERSAMGSGP